MSIDAKHYLNGWLVALVQMTTADINAIPEDQWTISHGGCSKPANAIVGDAVSLLHWTTLVLQGDTTPDIGAAYGSMMAACSTKEASIAKLKEAADAFSSALSAASDEALAADVMTPWQMPTPLYMVAQIAVSHVWYHDGQLNFIQCLLGDEKVHWMGG